MAKKQPDNLTLSAFFLELYLILNSGISLNNGLGILLEGNDIDLDKEILLKLHDDIDSGMAFYEALSKSGYFPSHAVQMIETGEKTGRLDHVLKSLSSYYERQEVIRQSIKNAVLYPFILIMMVFFVILIIITKVLPVFNDTFLMLGTQMGSLANISLKLGLAINNNLMFSALILIVICCAIFYIASRENIQKSILSKIKSEKLKETLASANFASSMSLCMNSGLDIDTSLEISQNLSKGSPFEKKIQLCRQKISEGLSFPESALSVKLFTPLFCQMLKIGFETGSSDIVMEEIAKRLQNNANNAVENTISKIEPILVVIMCVFIGIVLMSVMLPLMSIMTTIG